MCIHRESGLGESRIKRRLLNGPRRAQSKAEIFTGSDMEKDIQRKDRISGDMISAEYSATLGIR